MPTPDPRIEQLAAQLEERFFSHLPELTTPSSNPDQVRQNHLSRSLAAFAVSAFADVDNVTAASAVIDDFGDNGIDAIHFDRINGRLILVQSKFKKDGGEPSHAETKAFCDGVRDLLAQRYDRFNDAFQQKLLDVEEALEHPPLHIIAVLAWAGSTLGMHASRELSDFNTEMNQHQTDRCSIETFTLDRAYEHLTKEQAQDELNGIDLTLENWHSVDTPYRTFYGQVSARQLAELFAVHQKRLFEKNIRYYIGVSGVNEAIARTLREEPTHLFYLNNGLTAICSRITPKPTAKSTGKFVLDGFSIVNGAQTVGSIASVARTSDLSTSPAKVLITLIELNAAAEDFGTVLTYARNYQNQVRLIDFAALDPVQERIRRELAISSITYHSKPSQEAQRRDDNTLTLGDAALALASFSGRLDHTVTLKKQVGLLIDRKASIYPELFHSGTDSTRLCRAVRIYRFLDQLMTNRENGQEKLFYRHMRYFLLNIISRRSQVIRRASLEVSVADKNTLSRELDDIAALIYTQSLAFVREKGYLSLSRNLTDITQLSHRVMAALSQQDAQAAATATSVPPATT